MKIPKEFLLKGRHWKVIYVKTLVHDDGEKVDGICDTDKREILLDQSLKGPKLSAVFLHEIGHAFFYESHVGDQISSDLEEVFCDAFADIIFNDFHQFEEK